MWKTDEGVFFTTTARDISDRKLAEDLINKVNNCLLSFTPDPDKNIQTIVETVGLILNADGAAYHKIDSRYVTIKSQWNMQSSENSLPPIKAPNFRAMFVHNSDKACIYIPLHKQSFESKESSRMHYQFETSIAVPIKDYNTFMGTLNVSFKNKRILNQNEENALTILAKAIGTEEYRKRYLAKLIKNQRKLTAAKKRLDSFSQKILSIREEEKKSLSNNLHDEIGSMVVALSSCLTISKEEIIENNPDQALQRINQAETALRQSVDNLKKIVVDLRPPQFEIIGLSGILKELCTSFYHQTAIDLDCRFNIKDKHVSDNAAIAIYRVCQEALNNIVKHAKAKRVKIEINSEKRKITVSISDDGRGFDFRKYNDSYKGEIKLGLISMRERIEALGGTFIIESTQNQGTTIHATLPSR
jgi:signal transduction histidine kinase